jgi:DNA-binding GntR family transcriptional regulator
MNYDFHMLLSRPSERWRSLSILRGLVNSATIQIRNSATIQIREDIASWEGRRAIGEADHAQMLEAARDRDVDRMFAILHQQHTLPSIEHVRAQIASKLVA